MTTETPVHEFNGPPLGPAIEAAESRLTRDDDGLTLTVDTHGLEPGAHTIWWAVFNNPENCVAGCNGADLADPAVNGTVLYATGEIVGEDGVGKFTAHLAEGDTSGVNEAHQHFPGSEHGLLDAEKAEIHFVVRSHGPASDDAAMLEQQLSTFNGGCAMEGVEGFECFDPQAGIHIPPNVTFDNQVMHLAGTDTDVPASSSLLTRAEDGISVRVDAEELVIGDAVTLWWAVFNNPEFCEGGCNGPDLRNPDVQAGLFYGGGEVVDEDGKLTIMATRLEGDTGGVDAAHMDFAGAQTGLIDSESAEIHVALRSHGAASDDPMVLAEQLGTFNEGCNPGCANLQAAAHFPPGTEITVSPVHEFNGPPLGPAIEAASSRLTRDDDGLTLTVDTHGLEPGAHTIWWAVFNNPENCVAGCNGADLADPAVNGTVLYATGEIVGEDGVGKFTAHLAEGDTSGVNEAHQHFPGSEHGLLDAEKAEIHFVVRSHGPASDDAAMLEQQLSTFNGGCAMEGVEGFECFDPQAGIHIPPNVTFDNQVMHLAGTDTDVPASSSLLTRAEDGISVRVDAEELVIGDAVTLWWAVFNNPEFCEGGCNGPDLRNPDVQAGLFYGGGEVVDEDGKLTIMATRLEGDTGGVDAAHMDFAGAQTGLIDSESAEIHVALRSHGAASDDPMVLAEQLGTFNEGCNPGCANLQAAAHFPPGTEITVSPVHEFNGPPLGPAIEAASSRLTRDDDGLTLTVDTHGLEPGAHTIWWAVFNNPENCVAGCNGADLADPAVNGTVLYATGEIVGEDGVGKFTAHLAEGDTSGVNEAHQHFPGSEHGLLDAEKAEIHFVVRSHGPASDDAAMLEQQLSTFNGGCAMEGVEGFECFDPQAGIHISPLEVLGDIDGNGLVEFADFLVLSENFAREDATRAHGDLDGDGMVLFSDFLILAANI